MPKNRVDPAKEANDIQNIDNFVQKALEVLIGAGGHREDFKGLRQSLKGSGAVLSGVITDHWHRGYKAVTMAAFQKGLQRILSDCYFALKLFEPSANLSAEDASALIKKLDNPGNRNYILKVLGFKKAERDRIHAEYDSAPDKIQFIRDQLPYAGKTRLIADRKRRIEFMITGALCYVPFAEPNDGRIFNLPVKDAQGNYHLEAMRVERINMNPGLSGPYYALHLTPLKPDHRAQDHLLLMGTNPLLTSPSPAATLHADTVPGKSIGESLMDASQDRFEQLLRERFKENLLHIINNRLPEFTNEKGEIDYQKIWLAARIKCVGQSLGGSLSLQFLMKYPFMVEVAAFEPPFLLEKHREEIKNNLYNAHVEWNNLIDEIKEDITLRDNINLRAFKNVVPPDINALTKILRTHNIAIAQLIDYATKFGTVTPPVTPFHLDTKRMLPRFKKIKNKIYRGIMAGTLMSHAMVLAGQQDKVIRELKDINELFSATSRTEFTNLVKSVSKMIHAPIVGYLYLKRYFLDNITDPKWNASIHLNYPKTQLKMAPEEIKGKWEAIQRALQSLDHPYSWQRGDHLLEKIQELSRMMVRANQRGANIADTRKAIKEFLLSVDERSIVKADDFSARRQTNEAPELHTKIICKDDNEQKKLLYLDYFVLLIPLDRAKVDKIAPPPVFLEKIYTFCLDNLQKLQIGSHDPDTIKPYPDNIIEFYSLLGNEQRKDFLKALQKNPDLILLQKLLHYGKTYTEIRLIKNILKHPEGKKVSSFRSLPFSPSQVAKKIIKKTKENSYKLQNKFKKQ